MGLDRAELRELASQLIWYGALLRARSAGKVLREHRADDRSDDARLHLAGVRKPLRMKCTRQRC